MDTVVEVRGLEKRYGRVRALQGLDLTVARGEVHGFLGPNGAGKSTTIRVLLGLARADAGQARVLGADPWDDAVSLHRRMAYVPGDVTLWPNLSGGEAIDLLNRLRRTDRRGGAGDYAARRRRLLDAFELDPTKKGRAYSKGNRQKVALVAALATEAELYVLDEPTSGLDPLMEKVFAHEVERLTDDGATVLLSSHILSEVERLCHRVSIVRAGRTVETGTLESLRHLTRTEVSFAAGRSPAAASFVERLARLPGVHDVTTARARTSCTVESGRLGDLLPALAAAGVEGLTVNPPSLEELFLRHYGDQPA